jgi:hypothetical protein
MKISNQKKDILASVGVALLSMVLFVTLMGTVVMWGQSAGEKVRSKLSGGQSQSSTTK